MIIFSGRILKLPSFALPSNTKKLQIPEHTLNSVRKNFFKKYLETNFK